MTEQELRSEKVHEQARDVETAIAKLTDEEKKQLGEQLSEMLRNCRLLGSPEQDHK